MTLYECSICYQPIRYGEPYVREWGILTHEACEGGEDHNVIFDGVYDVP